MLLRTPWETFSVFIVLLLSLLFSLPDSSFISSLFWRRGFPDSSVDKESTCNAWHPTLIPGSGRSPGEGKGYPLQYSGLGNTVHGVAKSQTQLSLSPIHTKFSLAILFCFYYFKCAILLSCCSHCVWWAIIHLCYKILAKGDFIPLLPK